MTSGVASARGEGSDGAADGEVGDYECVVICYVKDCYGEFVSAVEEAVGCDSAEK